MKMEDAIAAFYVHKNANEMVDENGITLALIRVSRNGIVAITWESGLFMPDSGRTMPDVLRKELIRKLRQHADGLESREMDALVRDFHNKVGDT
jgi:hypothetical protein